jgi:hypothetical protein
LPNFSKLTLTHFPKIEKKPPLRFLLAQSQPLQYFYATRAAVGNAREGPTGSRLSVWALIAEVAKHTARPLPATKNQFHHEGHEEHEGVLIMVLITLRGLRVLRGKFLMYDLFHLQVVKR